MTASDDPDDGQFWRTALTFIWMPCLAVGYFYVGDYFGVKSRVIGMVGFALFLVAPLICFRAAFLLTRMQTRNTRAWTILNVLGGILCFYPLVLMLGGYAMGQFGH